MENIKPIEYCQNQIRHFQKKAKHNKAETLWCFRIIMGSTLAVPVMLTFDADLWVSKILPSFLSATAAFCTAWIQLRKPQELWLLYRTIQREIEDQLTQYKYKLSEYENCIEPDRLLASNVAKLTLKAHQKWTTITPTPDNLPPSNDSST